MTTNRIRNYRRLATQAMSRQTKSQDVRRSPKRSVVAARARLRAEQAMTLIEIMVVLVIIGMIAGGVAVAVIPKLGEARNDQARNDGLRLAAAVEGYMLDNNDCPTVDDLVESKEIKKATNDPWGQAFKIECDGDDITVISAGKDEQFGSEDDISTADDPNKGSDDE